MDVDEEQNEELAVPKADAVVNPWAVMVHIEHTPVARRAVMTPLWLKNVAHKAVSASLILRISQVEAPKYGYLAWIGSHGLYE